MKMYDQEKIVNFNKDDAVECLLDFSKGPAAVLITKVNDSINSDFDKDVKEFKSLTDTKTTITSQYEKPLENQPQQTVMNEITDEIKQPRAICSFCGKSFTHLGDHNKHRRRHTGERPYVCDLCPKAFGHASNLARHRRLHSGEKPFQCTGCSKKFSRRDKLRVHTAKCRPT